MQLKNSASESYYYEISLAGVGLESNQINIMNVCVKFLYLEVMYLIVLQHVVFLQKIHVSIRVSNFISFTYIQGVSYYLLHI